MNLKTHEKESKKEYIFIMYSQMIYIYIAVHLKLLTVFQQNLKQTKFQSISINLYRSLCIL